MLGADIEYWAVVGNLVMDGDNIMSMEIADGTSEPAEFEPVTITRQMVRDAWAKVADDVNAGNPPFRADLVQQMHDNSDPGDAGCVDSWVADCLVQIAAMGKVVFS